MKMKEFYLIPKNVYERMNSKQNQYLGGNKDDPPVMKSTKNKKVKTKKEIQIPLTSFVTTIQPPIKPIMKMNGINGKEDSVALKTLSRPIVYNDNKPSLSNLINLSFPVNSRNNALALLKVFEGIPTMEWNENGDLIYPLNKYNIIDIIGSMVNTTKKVNASYLDDYRYLVSTSNIPIGLIKNNSLRHYISTGILPPSKRTPLVSRAVVHPAKRKKKGGHDNTSWVSY